MNLVQLFGRLVRISLKKEFEYRFELMMMIIQVFFNIGFVILFWKTLFQFLPQLKEWTFADLLLYTAVLQLGEGLGGLFFGFRDMPELIISGEIDKYLVRPVNVLICLMFENVSIFYFLQQIIIGVMIMIIAIIKYKINIFWINMLPALLILIGGVLVIQLITGVITLLSFWVGRVDGLRNLFDKLEEIKSYPLNIFPHKIQIMFTYTIPIYFISYYPSRLILGDEMLQIKMIIYEIFEIIILVLVFWVIWKRGIRRYEANGG